MHFKPSGVCATGIDVETEGNIISKVKFTNGCSGNTQGISILVQGMDIDEAIKRLSGIRCGFKSTSCPDQLAKALTQLKNEAG